MKEAVEKIVKALVGNPEAVEVSEISDGRSTKIEVRVGEATIAGRSDEEHVGPLL